MPSNCPGTGDEKIFMLAKGRFVKIPGEGHAIGGPWSPLWREPSFEVY
jgi:hypothetical protein